MAAPKTAEDRILTVPNLISAARLACIPWFLWLLFSSGDRWGAALLWGALGATDWVDGWWARRFNSVSKVGKLLDPITDRAVLLVGVMAVGFDGSVPWWLVILTLAREGVVAVVGLVAAVAGRQADRRDLVGQVRHLRAVLLLPAAAGRRLRHRRGRRIPGRGLGVRGAVTRLQLPSRQSSTSLSAGSPFARAEPSERSKPRDLAMGEPA